MARTIGIGVQSFEKLIKNGYFYIDKTDLIREWWESGDDVTLIARPRRFGKTLNIDMLERFFSVRYKGQGQIFEGLSIWEEEKYRQIQGTYPVIALSFADIKEPTFFGAKKRICKVIEELYNQYDLLVDSGCLNEKEKVSFKRVTVDMEDHEAANTLKMLSLYLSRYYKRKVIILLDEYDTPMQEAYVNGFWKEMVGFIRSLFNSTFKTNPYLERALMTGITRVSKESIFSDLNNLEVVTSTSEKYSGAFGFTQQEVSDALWEYGLAEREQDIRRWYDGFTFGDRTDIYNPWSILNFLDKRRLSTYWANTSSNRLVGGLVRESSDEIKVAMEDLMEGRTLHVQIDEQIVFDQLDEDEMAIWSLLLTSGYLKVVRHVSVEEEGKEYYDLALTNFEVKIMFRDMIQGWFRRTRKEYNGFIRALLQGDVEAMNDYMGEITETVFSSFDTGKRPSRRAQPERFYHGLVLGLMMDLKDRYVITSNRESGFGRYDVQLEPKRKDDDGILLEFKVRDPKKEGSLEVTVQNALRQIQEKDYAAGLKQRGIEEERIRMYGFAFEGKNVLIR